MHEAAAAIKKLFLFPVQMGWRIFSRTFTLLFLPVSGAVWLVRLMGHYPKFRIADRVVLMTNPSSFGYSIQGPDAARRMVVGEHVLFLIASWRYDFNPEVIKLWKDIKGTDVVFIPRFVFVWQLSEKGRVILPFIKPHDSMVQRLTRWFVRLVGKERARFQSMTELCDEKVEAYRNEWEKMNLLYWQLTCESFFTPQEWQWVFDQAGYSGDFGFIYFE